MTSVLGKSGKLPVGREHCGQQAPQLGVTVDAEQFVEAVLDALDGRAPIGRIGASLDVLGQAYSLLGFPEIADLVRRTPPTATRRAEVVAGYLDFQLNGLHAHHNTEDNNLWPRLLERAAPDAALTERMERQHEVAAAAADWVCELAAQWRVTPSNGRELAAAIDQPTAVSGRAPRR